MIDRYDFFDFLLLLINFDLGFMLRLRDFVSCIGRFDGRALLDFIREAGARRHQEKTEEEEELEEFVNFERYRDLIKHRRRGCRYFLVLEIFRQVLYFQFYKSLFQRERNGSLV